MKVSSKLVVFLRARTMQQRAKTDKKRAEAVVADAEEKKQSLRIKELSAEAELAKHRSREAVAEKTREVNRAKEGRAAEKKAQEEQGNEEEQRRQHYAAWLARDLWTWTRDKTHQQERKKQQMDKASELKNGDPVIGKWIHPSFRKMPPGTTHISV